MNFRIFDGVDDLVAAAASTILQRVRKGERLAIALSGGSTPKPLYELLGSSPHREVLERVAITWVVVDERFVPPDHPQSNSAMIERTLFANGMPSTHRLLRFRTELGDPETTAADFERQWREAGVDHLDLILLGCGDDGHTASLFPGTAVLDVDDRVAAAVYVPRLEQWRVTLTLPVIREATLRLVLAAGASKRAIIDELRNGVDHPVARATGGGLETWWLVDRAAVGE